MTAKLTLTIEKETIEKAKRYAKNHQRSLSEIIQNSLENLININIDENDFSPKMKKIMSLLKDTSYETDEELEKYKRDYFESKYLK
jgi:hypothetical protein